MRRLLIQKNRWLLSITILASLLAGCTSLPDNSTPTPSGPQPPATTQPMPPVSGSSINALGWELSDGKRDLFSSHKGKVLVLDFYATWCAPCRDSVPELIDLQNKFGAQGVTVVGLNVGGPDDPKQVPEFAKELNIQYPLGTPDDELVALLLTGDISIPQTFVFDRQGHLVLRLIGFEPTTGDRMTKAVEAALKTSAD